MQSQPWLLYSLSLLLLLSVAKAQEECEVKLPLFNTSVRILGGRPAEAVALDNVVTLAYRDAEGINYVCVGSLIHPLWVLTAAQCPISADFNFVLHGGSSLTGALYEIERVISHPMYRLPTPTPWRYDLQLVQLRRPILLTSDTVPVESSEPIPEPIDLKTQNVMRVNNNSAFARSPRRTYLRLKGYGTSEPPFNNQQPLTHKERPLLFADMPISPCPEPQDNDRARRICTASSATCGPCFGDTGSPLYDVDKSGTVAVLVAVATLGRHDSYEVQRPFCTNGRAPIIYTTVAPYVSWIRRTMGNATLSEFFIPPTGINNVVLATPKGSLPVAARASIIAVCTLVLAGLLGTLIFLCIVRRMRARRRRWRTGLQAEDSFINSRAPDLIMPDPFEGIQRERQSTMSLSQLSSNAIERLKRAKEYSTRSLAAIRARMMKEEEPLELPREAIPDAPEWVSSAWDKLFRPPSKSDLSSIHKIPTQRVVDDVLSGADKSVEPSLQEVAFQAAREEANLEAAWHRLEVQTSLRSMSEAASTNLSPPLSPLPQSPQSGSRGMFASLSRSGSKRGSASSSPLRRALSSSRPPPGELAKADTLLAAFAPIDNESEHVEETIVDSAALRALATAKRPNVVNALRRMFSGSGMKESTLSSDGQSNGPASSSRQGASSRQAESSSGEMLESSFSVSGKYSLTRMDYFSENYSVSDSGSESDAKELFERAFMAGNRRYTDDRRSGFEETRSIPTLRGYRKGPSLSLDELEKRRSSHMNEEDAASPPEESKLLGGESERNVSMVSPALPLTSSPSRATLGSIEDESSSQVRELWSGYQHGESEMSQISMQDVGSGSAVRTEGLSRFIAPSKYCDSQTDFCLGKHLHTPDLESIRFEGNEKAESTAPFCHTHPIVSQDALESNTAQNRSNRDEHTLRKTPSAVNAKFSHARFATTTEDSKANDAPHSADFMHDSAPKQELLPSDSPQVMYETVGRTEEMDHTEHQNARPIHPKRATSPSAPETKHSGVLHDSAPEFSLQSKPRNYKSTLEQHEKQSGSRANKYSTSKHELGVSLFAGGPSPTGGSESADAKGTKDALSGGLPEVKPELPEQLGSVAVQSRVMRYSQREKDVNTRGNNNSDETGHLSVPKLKEIWNDRIRRDSESGTE
ncbi:Trypsin [Gracilaria domingensis]|nr:Trypsin [Gracilaria domingensis]